MVRTSILTAAVFGVVAWAGSQAWALDKYWIGGGPHLPTFPNANDWMDPANWSANTPTGGAPGVPSGTDRAIINTGTAIIYTSGTPDVPIDYLVVVAGATLVIQDGMNMLVRSDGATWVSSFGFNNYVEGSGTISTPPNGGGPGFGTGQLLVRNGTNGVLFNNTITTGNIRLDYTNGKPNINNPSQALRISSNTTITVNGNLNMALGAIQMGINPNSGGVVLDVRGDLRIGDPLDPLSASFLYLKASGSTIKCGGNWLQGGGKLKDTTGMSTTILNGSGNQIMQVNNADLGSCEFDTLIVGPGSRTVTYMNNPSLAPGFNITVSLILNNDVTFRLQDGILGIGSILFQDGNPVTPSNALLRLEGSVATLTTTLSAGLGTVEYAGPGIAQTVRAAAGPYYNLTIDNSGGVQATQENAAMTVQRTMIVGKAGSTVARFTGAPQNITVGKDFICNGTFTHGNSTLIMTTTIDGAGSIASDLPNPPPIGLTFNVVTVSGGVVPAPGGAMTATLENVVGNVTAGTHSYTATFVDSNNFESALGQASNIVAADATHGKVDLSSIPIGPTGIVKRRLYRTVAGNGGTPLFLAEIPDNVTTTYVDNVADVWLGAVGVLKVQPTTASTAALVTTGTGNVTNGTHSYAVTFVETATGIESATSPLSNVVTVDATHKQVSISNIPVPPAGYTKRLYRTLAGTANLRFLTALALAPTTFTDNVADTGLGAAPAAAPQAPAAAPTVALLAAPGNVDAGTHTYKVTFVDGNNVESAPSPSSAIVTTDAANPRVSLSAIPVGAGGAGILKRRLYRTVAGNAGNPLFVAEIGDNTTTTYTDNTSDGSLGPDGPITPAPPTSAPVTTAGAAGNVDAGLHSYYVTFVTAANVETAAGPGSTPLYLVSPSQVNVTSIPLGPAGTARRRIYRKASGATGSPLFLREIADNTTTTLAPVDDTADAALGVAAPPHAPDGTLFAVSSSAAGNVDIGTHSYCVTFVIGGGVEIGIGPLSNIVTASAGNRSVVLYSIPLGPAGAGVAKRRLYRTVAGNAGPPLFLWEIPDNTTTDFLDTLPDASLGMQPLTTSQMTVVTAARNFAVANTFTVPRGKLTLASGVAVDAQNGLTVGDNALPVGATSDATLELLGNVTLRIGGGRTLTVQPNDGVFVAGSLTSAAPTITNVGDSGGLGRFITSIQGIVDITKLEFRCADPAGLNINTTAAKVRNLRNAAFRNVDTSISGTRHLTINAPNLNMDCPGCFFDTLPGGDFNVQAKGAATNMRLRFEDRRWISTAARGAGAGEAFDNDDDLNDNGVLTDTGETSTGSVVQWVYTANIDMAGSIQGFPAPAFDWNSFTYYSTYVLMRNASGLTDSIYVLDGNGDLKPYSFTLPGVDIVGPLWWSSEPGGHFVYFGTTTGEVYRLKDNGSSLVSAGGFWALPYTDPNLKSVTSPVISDGVNLYFAGQDSFSPTYALYKVVIADKSAPNARISLTNIPVTTGFAWWDAAGTRWLYNASRAVGGSSYIGRAVTSTWLADAVYGPTAPGSPGTDCNSDFTGNVNVTNTAGNPTPYLYAGEANGYLHAVNAGGTAADFLTQRPGFPFRVKISPILGAAIVDFFGGRVFYGNAAGDIYVLKNSAGTWTLNTNYYVQTPPAGTAIQGMPLFLSGVLYISNASGQMFLLDVNNGSGGPGALPARTYTLGTAALGDISRDPVSGLIYVASSAGRLHSIEPFPDPTPGSP